ncbi:hypothetical protein ACWKSP_26455 [Micromonosporaceae bacterium Da 78-11]
MPEQPIGPILDGLGVTIDLPDSALVESAVVLAKVVHADGSVAVALSDSAGMSWLEQLALIAAAKQIVDDRPFGHPEDDD